MLTRAGIAFVIIAGLATFAAGQDKPTADDWPSGSMGLSRPETGPETAATEQDGETRTALIRRLGTLGPLLEELDRLSEEVRLLRSELAASNMDADGARLELQELRQFLADHHEYGRDFQEYQAVKAAAGRDARREQAERNRAELERKRAEREKRRKEARAKRDLERAEAERLGYYDDRGFAPIGQDVFLSRMAYNYAADDGPAVGTRLAYRRGIGRYMRFYPVGYGGYGYGGGDNTNFTTMTISGSVLNATDAPRNIGIAVTFFDDDGNQVGQETVRITNARPDVPYPFTAEVQMALSRPFASSSQYVLYADPVAE